MLSNINPLKILNPSAGSMTHHFILVEFKPGHSEDKELDKNADNGEAGAVQHNDLIT